MIEFKKFVASLLMGWLSVTAIFSVIKYLDTGHVYIGFVISVAIVTAIYSVVIGIPTYLALKGLQVLNLKAFIVAGICAALPMLIFCAYQGDVAFFVASLVAGVCFGLVAGLIHKRESKESLNTNID